MINKNIPKNIEEALDDEDIRNWFLSRDPNRKKVNPFISEETEQEYAGKASSLKSVEDGKENKLYGISFSQHQKHVSDTARHFSWIGLSIGLIIAIILALIF